METQETTHPVTVANMDIVFGLPYIVKFYCRETGLGDTSASQSLGHVSALTYEKARIAAMFPDMHFNVVLSYKYSLRSKAEKLFVLTNFSGHDLLAALRWEFDGVEDVER